MVAGLINSLAYIKLEHPKSCPKESSISQVSTLESLKSNSLYLLLNTKVLKTFQEAQVPAGCACIVNEQLWTELSKEQKKILEKKCSPVWLSQNSAHCMSDISKIFYDLKYHDMNFVADGRQMGTAEIDPSANIAQNVFIGENVIIGKNVRIFPGCTIMPEVVIEDGVTLFPNVSIYSFVKIGKETRIHSNSTIGADGFGYQFHGGVHHKIWHYGGVEIGESVEVGANSAIDGGTFTPTLIGRGSKFDNHVQVAHNCQIGEGVILCGGSGVAGSSKVGDYCVFGGHAALADNRSLGKGSQVAGGAVITSSWPENSKIGGFPARDLREWMKSMAALRSLALRKSKEK